MNHFKSLFTSLLLNITILALLWSPSFLFIKIAVQEVSPISIVTCRVIISALLLLLLLKIKKVTLPRDPKLWFHCFIMGIIATSLPFILYGYSLTRIDSILSALINSTTPVTTLILANFFLRDERFTLNRCLGVALGCTGFFILCSPCLFQKDLSSDLLGMFLSFVGASCYAFGMVYARRNINFPKEPLVLPTLQLVTSLVYLIPLMYFIDPPLNLLALSWKTHMSIAGLAIFGTALGFIMYYKILKQHKATSLSFVTYIMPLFSTFIGIVFANEQVTPTFCVAAGFILLGIMVANKVIRLPFSKGVLRHSASPR